MIPPEKSRALATNKIGSAPLVADGYHARTDGWTSLAVLAGAVGVWLGYPLADPVAGLSKAAAILVIVWQSGKAVFTRMLDGVEPEVVGDIRHAACGVDGVEDVSEVRARWLGHGLRAEVNVAVSSQLSVAEDHDGREEGENPAADVFPADPYQRGIDVEAERPGGVKQEVPGDPAYRF